MTPPGISALVASCEIDHAVPPSGRFRGGAKEAHRRLRHLVQHNLPRHAEHKNEPSAQAASKLSPYLHFGMISSLEVALAAKPGVESFLEELIVRRELAFAYARSEERLELLGYLPDWTRKTPAQHDRDPRDYLYSRELFESARAHDDRRNAGRRELRLDGVIHCYYRMCWCERPIFGLVRYMSLEGMRF